MDVASGDRRWKDVMLHVKERRGDVCLYVTGFFPQKVLLFLLFTSFCWSHLVVWGGERYGCRDSYSDADLCQNEYSLLKGLKYLSQGQSR